MKYQFKTQIMTMMKKLLLQTFVFYQFSFFFGEKFTITGVIYIE